MTIESALQNLNALVELITKLERIAHQTKDTIVVARNEKRDFTREEVLELIAMRDISRLKLQSEITAKPD